VAILALATSGPHASVGLLVEGRPLAVRALGSGAERGRGVAPAVDALLTEHGLRPADVRGIAVDVGPGSFTGVRVGVATAKAMAFGLSVPVVGVESLEALAVAAGPADAPLLVLRDARAGEAYFGLYRPLATPASPEAPPPAPPSRLMKASRGRADAIRAALEERSIARAIAVGEDAERLAITLPLTGLLAGVRTEAAGPAAILALALPRLRAGTTDDVDALAPRYLQPSTPERRLEERAAGKKPS
jgi:tRNA threonylcarbamoyladenosine biosynthesis protein TsaB